MRTLVQYQRYRSVAPPNRVYEVGSIVNRGKFGPWVVFWITVVLGPSSLFCSTTGTASSGFIALSWHFAGPSGAAGSNNVYCPGSTTSLCGFTYSPSAAPYYLNDTATASPYIGWHNYKPSTTVTAQQYLDGLYICQTTCTTSHLTFNLNGSATLNMGPTSEPVNLYRAPVNDNGYYLSTPGGSSITITFPTGKYANDFEFYWGSIDSYNSITFTDIRGSTFTTAFSGSSFICSGSSTTNCFVAPNSGTTPAYNLYGAVVDFRVLPDASNHNHIYPWTSITFTSSSPAFEFDNIRWNFAACTSSPCSSAVISPFGRPSAPVPEPSSMALLGTGIAGVITLLRRGLRS